MKRKRHLRKFKFKKLKLKKLNLKPFKFKKFIKIGNRKIRTSFLILVLSFFILLWCLINIPKFNTNNQLKKLGYSKSLITEIKNQKLTKKILKDNLYSKYLASSIKDKSLKVDYIELYTIKEELENKDFLLYSRLIDKGYKKDVILNLFKSLRFYEITPLLVFDFQENIQTYIDDCMSHREENNEDKFVLSNSYYTPYKNTIAVENGNSVTALVNKTHYLDSSFVPDNLVDVSIKYGSEGIKMQNEAYDALKSLINKASKLKDEYTGELPIRFYATNAYRSYEKQESVFNNYVKSMGEEKAELISAKAGFSENQTGLTMDITAVGNEKTPFEETEAYKWVITNITEFGFILRYPENKTSITGFDFAPWHYRYIGKEYAEQLKESKLTFDEFYMLYISKWNDETNAYKY